MQPSPTAPAADSRRSLFTRSLHAGTFIALVTLGACRDPKIAVYTVPKESAAPRDAIHAAAGVAAASPAESSVPAADASMAGSAVPTAAGHSLTWTAPATWQSKQGSTMRKATYAVVGEGGAADLAVTAFPGDVGGEIANVNRWRGQVGLSPVDDGAARSAIQRIDANGLEIGVVDIASGAEGNGVRLLGAWVPHDGATWFFKLLGPDAVVAKEKAAFLEFLKTIRPAAPAKP